MPRLENEYPRVVKPEGNVKALEMMKKAFTVTGATGAASVGFQTQPCSCVNHSKSMMHEKNTAFMVEQGKDILLGCECHLVIIGKIKPNQCPMFLKACTPAKPVGACMVSSEGTCRVWAKNAAAQA